MAINKKIVSKKRTTEASRAHLDFLFSPWGQEILVKHNFGPRDVEEAKRNAARFPAVKNFTFDSLLGCWSTEVKTHFAGGSIHDPLIAKR